MSSVATSTSRDVYKKLENSTEPDVGIDIAKRFVLQFYPLTSRTRDVTANNCYSHQFITLISVATCSDVDAV